MFQVPLIGFYYINVLTIGKCKNVNKLNLKELYKSSFPYINVEKIEKTKIKFFFLNLNKSKSLANEFLLHKCSKKREM